MKGTRKFLVSLLSVICVVAFAISPCSAAAPSEITPLWNNVGHVTTSLDIYDDAGVATASVGRGNIATSLHGVLTVYWNCDGDWMYLDSMTKSATNPTLFISFEFDIVSNMDYKMELVVTAYSGSTIIEEITDVKYASSP